MHKMAIHEVRGIGLMVVWFVEHGKVSSCRVEMFCLLLHRMRAQMAFSRHYGGHPCTKIIAETTHGSLGNDFFSQKESMYAVLLWSDTFLPYSLQMVLTTLVVSWLPHSVVAALLVCQFPHSLIMFLKERRTSQVLSKYLLRPPMTTESHAAHLTLQLWTFLMPPVSLSFQAPWASCICSK